MHPAVQACLSKHLRIIVHLALTGTSWLNMGERFFRSISVKRIRRGIFSSVAELEMAIAWHVAHHNSHPKPFIWTATAAEILAQVTRAKAIAIA